MADFLQGSPLADYAAAARRRRAHPVITAFNTLGYDAATLGNHEFDYGLRFLSGVLADARFPVVSANIATRLGTSPARDETLVPPFAILRRQIIDTEGRAHVLGSGSSNSRPPRSPNGAARGGPWAARDVAQAAHAPHSTVAPEGPRVCVSWGRWRANGPPSSRDRSENAATALAALPEIDAVIAGHSHQVFPGPGFAPSPGIEPRDGSPGREARGDAR